MPTGTKNQEKLLKLNEFVAKKSETIQAFLTTSQPSVSFIRITLRSLYQAGALDAYLKQSKYHLFHWSLEHDSLELIQVLVEFSSQYRQFLMVSNNNYAALKKYISGILQSNLQIYDEQSTTKLPILRAIISIKPHPVVEFIKETIKENKENEVAAIFSRDIEKIIADVLQTDVDMKPVSIQNSPPSSPTHDAPYRLFSTNPPPKKRVKLEKGEQTDSGSETDDKNKEQKGVQFSDLSSLD